MKTITPELKEHWESSVRTIATCWLLELKDGTKMGFTTHDEPIEWDGVTYSPAGFTPTKFEQSSDMSVDGMDVQGFLDSEAITEADIAAGRFDRADVYTFKINWADTSQGILKLPRGWIGEIGRQDRLFVAEVRSLTQALQQKIGEEYLGRCPANVGDDRCKVDLDPLTVTGSVDSVASAYEFTDTSRSEDSGLFDYGLLTWTSGDNEGRESEVKAFDGSTFLLFDAMPEPIQSGDEYEVYPGCDKKLATCRDQFSNVANFRGFPYIPGSDNMNQIG